MSTFAQRTTRFATPAEVANAAADIVARTISVDRPTRIVLAGGTTPRLCHECLAGAGLSWGRVSILFGDERCVPPLDADSNYRAAHESLLAAVAPANVHRMPAELGPDLGAKAYEAVVAAAPLDLVLLGLGPDGHTASLFPGHPALQASTLVVGVRNAPKPPPDRVSLTLKALRAAKRVVVLATGADKADAVAMAARGEVPSGMIEHAEWLVSENAAGGLQGVPPLR